MPWLLLKRELRDRSDVSLLTSWEVVCPTTPLEKSGGISMLKDDPTLDELSLRARLLPSPSSSSSSSSSSASCRSRSICARSRLRADIWRRTSTRRRGSPEVEAALEEAAAADEDTAAVVEVLFAGPTLFSWFSGWKNGDAPLEAGEPTLTVHCPLRPSRRVLFGVSRGRAGLLSSTLGLSPSPS